MTETSNGSGDFRPGLAVSGGGTSRPRLAITGSILRGRAAELARLDALIETARAGAGEIIVVDGAAGIGKSRLLTEACGRAAQVGLIVAASAADELDQVTPWGPLLRALSSSGLLDLAGLNELRTLSDQRLAVIDRMHSALEAASIRRPLLIALDDLQWADAATLLALGTLPRELFSYPVAWLLARRPLPSTPALEALLARLEAAGAIRLHIGPLDAPAAAALAADVAGASLPGLAGLTEGAEGNPFYLIELLRAASRTAKSAPATLAAELPGTVRAAVVRHLRSLSDRGRRLLGVASVLGRDFSVAELAEMTGEPASQLMPEVGEALAAEVFIEVSDRIAFRHDLLRQAVYEDLPVSLRAALHRDAADALRRSGAPVVRIAGQLAIGARPGDSEAITALSDAVRELLPTSPGSAADLAVRALELAGERDRCRDSDERDRCPDPELVLAAVHALALAGRGRDALALGRRHLASGQLTASAEAALELDLRQAWLLERDFPYPDPLSERLVNDPAADPVVYALASALERASGMWVGRGEEADREIDRAYEIVLASGRALEFGTVAYLRVSNSMLRGRLVEALARARAGLEISRQLERPRSSGTHEVLTAVALGGNGRYAEALSMLRSALAASVAVGRPHLLVRCQWLRAFQLLAQGNLEDARGEGQTAAATADEFCYPDHRAHGLVIVVEAALRQGDMAGAQSALSRFGPAQDTGPMNDRYWAAAITADAKRDAAAAGAALGPLRAQFDEGAFAVTVSQHHRLPALVQIALRAGDTAAALSFAQAAATLAGQNPGVDSLAAAGAYARGLVERDPASLREAVGLASGSQARLLETAAREDLGRMLEPGSEAVEQLEAAYNSYVRAGAHRDTARVRAALRSLGIHKRQSSVARPRQGWDSLTRSELAVVDLVARGLTNREAAADLFLSPDTVNTHLRHAFAKLGVRSRVELARLAAQRDAAPARRRSAYPDHG